LGLEDAIPAPQHVGFPGDRQSRPRVQSKGLDLCDSQEGKHASGALEGLKRLELISHFMLEVYVYLKQEHFAVSTRVERG
jgi:hypothetical protein